MPLFTWMKEQYGVTAGFEIGHETKEFFFFKEKQKKRKQMSFMVILSSLNEKRSSAKQPYLSLVELIKYVYQT